MHARTAVAIVATLALVYACGSRTHAFSLVTAAATTATPDTPTSASSASRLNASAAAGLVTSLDVTTHGNEVRFFLHVANTSTKKLELTFPNGQTHDITVLDAVGGTVWRWSDGEMFTQALRNQPLDPHTMVTYSARWRRPEARGSLTAVGTLTSTNYPLETRSPFTLP